MTTSCPSFHFRDGLDSWDTAATQNPLLSVAEIVGVMGLLGGTQAANLRQRSLGSNANLYSKPTTSPY